MKKSMNDQSQHPRYSIVAPAFNEEAVLHILHQRIAEVMDKTGEPWELVIVNDGSRDQTGQIVRELHTQDPRVKLVDFARNFGHQLAVTAGLDHSRGDAVVIIDADLQDPPKVILEMIERWKEGYEVVYAVRSEREGETWFKEFTAKLFYRLIYRITDVDIPMDTGDFRLLDRSAVQVLNSMRERNRFIRGMSVWIGFRQTGVTYKRRARVAGETKYPFRKMFRFALDAITSFSYLPLQLASYLGFLIAGLSALSILIVILLRLLGSGSPPLYGQATTLVAVLFIGGVQLISIGIIGEYIGRIYDEVKARPLYIVRETLGIEEGEATPLPPNFSRAPADQFEP
jgi:dolichol-phosphate mannosyltransferase